MPCFYRGQQCSSTTGRQRTTLYGIEDKQLLNNMCPTGFDCLLFLGVSTKHLQGKGQRLLCFRLLLIWNTILLYIDLGGGPPRRGKRVWDVSKGLGRADAGSLAPGSWAPGVHFRAHLEASTVCWGHTSRRCTALAWYWRPARHAGRSCVCARLVRFAAPIILPPAHHAGLHTCAAHGPQGRTRPPPGQ